MKKIRHMIEALALALLFVLFRLLPLDAASWLGGFLARMIGPFLRAQNIAERNLARVMPEIPEGERKKIINRMWDHLGRVAAEMPHLPGTGLTRRATIQGVENIPKPGEKANFISGHFGNWELTYPILYDRGVPTTLIYRQANNLYADKIINFLRGYHSTNMFPKGGRGASRMAHALTRGESLAMLVDQKMNDGIPVPFFGRDAMTAPAVAKLALRYDMPIIPVRVTRTRGAHFESVVFPPLVYQKTDDEKKDVLLIMTEINRVLESWIRERPEQWFWVHKRWPD